MQLHLADARITRVGINSTRRALPASLTIGRAPAEVAAIVPRLFAVCGQAQGAAAACALQAATGANPAATALRQGAAGIDCEAIVELLTRLLLDWPRVLDAAPAVAPLARARQAAGDRATLAAIAHEHVFGSDAASFLACGSAEAWSRGARALPAGLMAQLERTAPDLTTDALPLLPLLSAAELGQHLPPLTDDDSTSRRPQWHGRPALTGPLARHADEPLLRTYLAAHGPTVAAHLLAQLVDLARRLAAAVPAADTLQSTRLADGSGVGLAVTARGLLLHQARVDAGRVVHYRIVAPTEWNFHPDGALPCALRGRRAADAAAARHQAQLVAQALDPCVACTVEIADA